MDRAPVFQIAAQPDSQIMEAAFFGADGIKVGQCLGGMLMSAVSGVEKGRLLPGYDADFALVDENREWVVDAAQFASKGKNSPFDGVRLQGKVVRTIKAGKTTWQE